MSSLTDLARRVHDLVREPKARELFRRRTNEYIVWRIRNCRPTKKIKNGWVAVPLAPYFPFERFDDWESPPEEPIPDVTVAEKFAVLAAHHDNHYADDNPILPRPDCQKREPHVWFIVLRYVRDRIHQNAERVEDWYKDVLAELETASADAKSGATTLEQIDPAPLRLTSSMNKILQTCRRKHYKGETLANKVGLEYNYARKVFAKLVKGGKLRNDPARAYRTV